MINVTKTYLPNREKLNRYIDELYKSAWITNDGVCLKELTARLEKYLNVRNLLLVSNGTLALQVAYKTQGITGNAITTPFSFVATTSSLVWEGIKPVFSDIDPDTFCIDPEKIEDAITSQTTGIVPVHVFGNGCDVEHLESIARDHNLKIIFDGAHAFGVKYKGNSLLSYGDATILSFHATKLFHTIEGGAIIFKNRSDFEAAKKLINFGITGPDSIDGEGINAKMNEFQAAMGLCVLDEIDRILKDREEVFHSYEAHLNGHVMYQKHNSNCTNNYSYFPIVFKSEKVLLHALTILRQHGINPRRYFYPSLDTLNYLQPQKLQPVSRDIASRILCLPTYSGLSENEIEQICSLIKKAIEC
jgi:dTDP-4-amino-4,6-dideoxygalactose transaminase